MKLQTTTLFAFFSTLITISLAYSGPAATAPAAPVRQLRQATRSEIVRRNNRRLSAPLSPRQSARVYPACVGAKSPLQGYASYQGWDLLQDNLPGNALTGLDLNDCISACTNDPDFQGECGAVFWWPNAVYLGTTGCYPLYTYTYALYNDLTNTDTPAETGGVLNLGGQCGDYASIIPSAMDLICCNA